MTWRPSNVRRSRRPLLLALCAVVLLVHWHHLNSDRISSQRTANQHFDVHSISPRSPAQELPPGIGSQARISLQDKEEEEELENGQRQEIRPGVKVPVVNTVEDETFEPDDGQQAHDRKDEDVPQQVPADHQEPEQDGNQIGTPNDVSPPQQQPGKDVAERAEAPESNSELNPDSHKESLMSSFDRNADGKPVETEPEDHLSLEKKAELLPEIVHTTFEDAVKDVELQGWEDEWIADAFFNANTAGMLEEPKIDFVYLWANGSEKAFQDTKRPFELNSILNDAEGKWISSHGTNRYRDWDELRYSLRSIEKHAAGFKNRIQILVNSVKGTRDEKQIPTWLKDDAVTRETVQVFSQEEYFDQEKQICLPTFNSLTMENQIFNTPSNVDQLFALSDDMLLGKPHAASDIYSPLFGPVMGFKTNGYSTTAPPTDVDAHRFGEKPFLIYTSWLLNRRFGIRKRKGQGHFGHSLSRSVTREALASFPGPELQSACKRFRGEPGFQVYSWYATFHYLIERQREALLWSYLMLRSDVNNDGILSWDERLTIMQELEAGMKNEGKTSFRKRMFYHYSEFLEQAGLEAPKATSDILWTSLDGPSAIRDLDCVEFDVNECLAPGFSTSTSDQFSRNPVFSTAAIFAHAARAMPHCGDCLLKLILNQVRKGLSPLLPNPTTQAKNREIVIKAAMRYQYTIVNPDALFVMVTDAEQIDSTLVKRYLHSNKPIAGQLCLNDDVTTDDESELQDIKEAMGELYGGLFPEKSPYEK